MFQRGSLVLSSDLRGLRGLGDNRNRTDSSYRNRTDSSYGVVGGAGGQSSGTVVSAAGPADEPWYGGWTAQNTANVISSALQATGQIVGGIFRRPDVESDEYRRQQAARQEPTSPLLVLALLAGGGLLIYKLVK